MATRRTTDSPRSTRSLTPEKPTQKPLPRKRASAPAAPPAATTLAAERVEISAEARRGMIAEAAYLRAQARGFSPGYELDDWIAAESEVDSLLDAEHTRIPQ